MIKELYRDLEALKPNEAYAKLAKSGWKIYEYKECMVRSFDTLVFSRLCEKNNHKIIFIYLEDKLVEVSEVYAPGVNTYGEPNGRF